MKNIIACSAIALSLAATGRLWATEVTWKSSVASGGWHTGSNWNGNYAPGSADTAVFNSDATVTFSTPSKTSDNHITCVKITSGATVTFKCDDDVVFYPKTFEGSTSETVILDGATFSVDGQSMTIPVTLRVKDETVNTFKLGNKADRSITISGNMTGSGTLYIDFINENKSNGVTFSGNNENFSGKVEVINTSGQTDYSSFANASATSANATWNLVGAGMKGSYDVNKEMLTTKPSTEGSEMVTYEFGSISNIFTIGNNESGLTVSDSVSDGNISRTVVNIGGNNEDSSTAGCFGWATLHKKGTGKLEFSAKYPYAVFIDAGTLYIADSDSAPQDGRLIFNGDGATLATSTSLDISKYGSKQPLKGNSQYPICFSNATSEVHYWATALDNSNTAGLRKIGDGALHLGAAPGYATLPITVEGGTLAVNGSVNAANVTLKPANPAAAASAGTVLFWAKTVSSGTPTLDSSLTALYRLKTITDASLTINGTEYTGTAYSIEKRGEFVIGTDTKISLGTSDLATAEAAANGWTIALSDERTNSGQKAEYFKITLVQEGGEYYVSYALDENVVRPTLNTPGAFGISGGNASFAVDNVKAGLWYSIKTSDDVNATSYNYPKTTEKDEAGRQATSNGEAINLSLPLPTGSNVQFYRIAVDDVEPAWTTVPAAK